MAGHHLENYVTTVWQRESAQAITAELAAVVGLHKGDTISEEKLLEIEQHLATAHEHFLARHYIQAINEYKLTLGLIYKLLHPKFKPPYVLRPEFLLSYDPELFKPMLEISMELVDMLPVPQPRPDFGVIDSIPALDERLTQYDQLGINVLDGIMEEVRRESAIGAAYAERGQWDRAETHFLRAQESLGRPGTQEGREAQAALDLNLSSIYIQKANIDEAMTRLERASSLFGRSQDMVGQAQVSFNTAAAHTRAGRFEEAEAQRKQGEQFLSQAQGLPDAQRSVERTSTTSTSKTLRSELVAGMANLNSRPLMLDTTATLFDYSTHPDKLAELSSAQGMAVTYRQPGKAVGWTIQEVETRAEAMEKATGKSLGLLFGEKVVKVEWTSGSSTPTAHIIDNLYEARVNAINWIEIAHPIYLPTDLAVQLPHLYYYVIPVALGDCYHAIGEYQKAETEYLKAADYQYINLSVEVPALWRKLAENVLAWGDALYKAEEYQDALNVYRKVLEVPGGNTVVWADSPLHRQAKLKVVGDTVKAMLENYDTAGPGTLNPLLAAVVLEIRARMLQLQAGLDFLGIPATMIPIWSFDYLQNVARYFGQQASQAERDYINFQVRGEDESFTRLQLKQSVDLAEAERELARQQREAAQFEAAAYDAGRALADQRTANAQANRTDYAAMTSQRIELERANAWYTAQNPWELENTIAGSGPDAGRHIHEVVSERTAKIGQITRAYELASMDRQIAELQQAEIVAQQQLNAANARVEAAEQLEVVADLRISAAEENLDAFDSQVFTPDVWYQMAQFMRSISQSYFVMALKIARMMQRAYNFENDLDRHFIRTDYTSTSVQGMLAADALLRDIDSFTYDQITTVQRKEIPVVQTMSLANSFPFLFETEFRQNGRMGFETRLEDLDIAYPGTYSQRIESIEVEIEGILPAGGVRGTLTNGGISRYRNAAGTIKYRIQSKETLVLSEYRIKPDAVVFPADTSRLKIFEGAGVAGTWELELPPSANDLNFRTVTDVRIVFYYRAKYDPVLAVNMKAQVAALAGATQRSRNLALRYIYPDLFFGFQETGQLAFTLTPLDFPFNEVDPQITELAVVLVTDPGVNPSGWTVRLGTPGNAATVPAQADAQGEIIAAPGQPWQPLTGDTALGDYLVEVRADENPALVTNGVLNLRPLRNIVLLLTYNYTPRT